MLTLSEINFNNKTFQEKRGVISWKWFATTHQEIERNAQKSTSSNEEERHMKEDDRRKLPFSNILFCKTCFEKVPVFSKTGGPLILKKGTGRRTMPGLSFIYARSSFLPISRAVVGSRNDSFSDNNISTQLS